jgi:ParB family transcriptional regulator, chromosome partitioning protein
MRPAKLIEVADIALANIDCSNRLRPVTEAAVVSLTESIELLGLQAEIHIRRVKKSGELRLIAGAHRLEVFRRLGRTVIPAKVWDCTDEWAALAEIDDNLAHAELDALEMAVFLARRKNVYERVYPETKRGAAGNAAKLGLLTDNVAVRSFAASAADKMGVSERSVFRLLAAGQALGAQEIDRLRDAPKKVTLADLQIIAKCSTPEDRFEICKELGNGDAKSAKEVMNRRKAAGASVKDPAKADLMRLKDAFQRASAKVRQQFVQEHREALLLLMDVYDAKPGTTPTDVIPFKARNRG